MGISQARKQEEKTSTGMVSRNSRECDGDSGWLYPREQCVLGVTNNTPLQFLYQFSQ